MKPEKLRELFQLYESALARFREVLLLPKNEVIRDSSIKRFEIVFELAWKVLKLFLEIQEGILVATPKSTFREATVAGILDPDNTWMRMVDTRNDLVHAYDQVYAERVYNENLKKYLQMFEYLFSVLKNKINDLPTTF